jgi:hypothetical protein
MNNGTTQAQATPTEQPETDNQRKLRELRAQRAALVSARLARDTEREEAEEIAAEERALRDEAALNDAIEKHGPLGTHVAVVETLLGNVILKRASAMKFRRFQDKGDANTEDVAALVRPCVVWPSPGELDVILDELPATLVRMASVVIELAGQRSGELAKK